MGLKMYKLVMGLLISLTLRAADETFLWPDNGVPVRQGVHIEWQRTGDANADGTMIFAWSDTRTGDRDVYAQKVDTDGNTLWGDTGVRLSNAMGRQEDPVLVSDGNGGAFVSWIDYRDDEGGDVYVQHVTASGEISWDAAGVPVAVNDGSQQLVNMARGADGYAYVIWYDTFLSQETDIFGTVLNLDGPLVDTAVNGFPVVTASGSQSSNSIETSGSEAVIVWMDSREPDNSNIYAQRVDTTFTRLWGDNGKLVCGNAGPEDKPKVVPADGNRVAVAWKDSRVNQQGDIYAQLLDENGDAVWTTDGIPVTSHTAKQENVRLKTDGTANIYIIWEDFRNQSEYSDVYIQSLDFNGTIRWEANGLPVSIAAFKQVQPRLTGDDTDGVFVVWQDERDGGWPKSDIYIQHVASDGSMVFDENGMAVTSGLTYQISPLVRSDGNDGAFVVWGGQETGSIGINGQHISTSGTVEWDPTGVEFYYGIDGDATRSKVLPWGEDEFLVMWEDHRKGSQGSTAMAQVMDNTAAITYALNGKPLSQNAQQDIPSLVSDGNGGGYLGFLSNEQGILNLYAQHLDPTLTPTWGDNGVRVYDQNYFDQDAPLLVKGEDGFLYYIWSEVRNFFDNDVFVQKFDPYGNPQWADGGVSIAPDEPGDDYAKAALAMADSGIVIVWQTTPTFDNLDLYVSKMTADGTVAWRQTLADAQRNQENPRAVYDAALDRFYVAWEDPRGTDTDIYMKYGDSDGNLSQDIIITDAVNDQVGISLSIADDGSGAVWAAWQDYRDGVQYDIWVRNMTTAAPAEQITDLPSDQIAPAIRVVTADRYLLAWEDFRNDITSDLYFFDNMGAAVYSAANGALLCNAISKQTAVKIVPYADSTPDTMKYVLVWEDKRASGKTELFNIYAQTYSNDFTALEDEPAQPLTFSLGAAYPNPFNGAVTVPFSQPVTGQVQVTVFDLLGRNVYSRIHTLQNQSSLLWAGMDNQGRSLQSGIYFLNVWVSGQSFTQKVTYLK
ncbi:MAG: T9SS type A sorting domain-containing protein [Candidatus Marinimicrobia bacterium]|nr:T9SS type A sorting domain-containing protein [Candidatus Neomarinimicrobiota bacterium]